MFKVLKDVVVVELEEDSDMTDSGLYLPDTRERVEFDRGGDRGTVIAVGPGKRDKKGRINPLTVQVGDTVCFNRTDGSEYSKDGKQYLFFREEHLTGIMEVA